MFITGTQRFNGRAARINQRSDIAQVVSDWPLAASSRPGVKRGGRREPIVGAADTWFFPARLATYRALSAASIRDSPSFAQSGASKRSAIAAAAATAPATERDRRAAGEDAAALMAPASASARDRLSGSSNHWPQSSAH